MDTAPQDSNLETEAQKEATPPEPQEKPQPKPWPKRRKGEPLYETAMAFIGMAILHYEKIVKKPLTVSDLGEVKRLYGVWCWNTGLRGKEKSKVWNIIHAQILEIKRVAKSKTEEL